MISGPHVENEVLGRRVADDGGDEVEDEVPEGFQFRAHHNVQHALFDAAADHSADRRPRLIALLVAYEGASAEQFAPVPLFSGIGDWGAERFPNFVPWDVDVGKAVVFGVGVGPLGFAVGAARHRPPPRCGRLPVRGRSHDEDSHDAVALRRDARPSGGGPRNASENPPRGGCFLKRPELPLYGKGGFDVSEAGGMVSPGVISQMNPGPYWPLYLWGPHRGRT